MNSKRRISALLVLAAAMALLALAAFVAVTKAEGPSGVTPTILARGTYDSFNVRSNPQGTIADFRAHSTEPIDIIVRQHDYAPHPTTGWHTHPGPVFVSVAQGELTYFTLDDPCTPHVVTAGHGFVDTGVGHVVLNETDQPARDISVITAPVGGVFRANIDPPSVNCG
jgi:quercetin dioxygenase-like cupin family protein